MDLAAVAFQKSYAVETAKANERTWLSRPFNVRILSKLVLTMEDGMMHYAISATWGPTDPTRASLPFIFAASALERGDSIMIMLFHDAVSVAVEGVNSQLVPVGPPQKFDEVFAHANAEIIVCKPCAAARGISEEALTANCRFGGMNDYLDHVSRDDCKPVSF